MQIEARGLSFACAMEGGGEDRPCVMFSNSLATNLSLWDDQVRALGGGFRILRYDQRGHGGSGVSPAPYSFVQLAEDAVGLLDALHIERVHFVGISMGGVTALALAERYPQRLMSITVCDARSDAGATHAADWGARIAVARDKGMDALVEPTLARWFTAASLAAGGPALATVRRMIASTPVEGFAGCAGALSAFDVSRGLAAPLPALFVSGAEDGVLAEMQAMQARMAGAEMGVVAGARHLPNIERPDDFNRLLLPFLKKCA